MKRAALGVCVALSLLAGCGSASDSSAPEDTRAVIPEDEFADPGESDNSDTLAANTCSQGTPVEGRPLRVVTTIAPLTSLVGLMVAGTDIEVTGLVPEDSNVHVYSPSAADVEAIQNADLVVTNGIGLEASVVELTAAALPDGTVLCEAGTAAFTRSAQLHSDQYPSENNLSNPHAWLAPNVVMRYLNPIRDALSARSPADVDVLDENYVKLSGLMQQIDEAMKTDTETVPVRNRSLYTYHDAFVYVGRQYGYGYLGAAQRPDMTDPDPLTVAAAMDALRASNVPAVFPGREWGSTVPKEMSDTLAVPLGGELADEDLPGRAGEAGHSIGGLIIDNFVTIVETLGGQPTSLRALTPDIGVKDAATYAG